MSILLQILAVTRVNFEYLKITLKTGSHPNCHGVTHFVGDQPQEIVIFLGELISDVHFLAVFLHELGHCIAKSDSTNDHDELWFLITTCLVAIMNVYQKELSLINTNRHEMCVCVKGMDVIDKFQEQTFFIV